MSPSQSEVYISFSEKGAVVVKAFARHGEDPVLWLVPISPTFHFAYILIKTNLHLSEQKICMLFTIVLWTNPKNEKRTCESV